MEARIKGTPIHPLLRECVCYLRAGKTTVSAKFIADILYGSTAANHGGKAKEHKVSNHTFDRRMIELKQIEHITSKYGHQQNRENGQARKKERETFAIACLHYLTVALAEVLTVEEEVKPHLAVLEVF